MKALTRISIVFCIIYGSIAFVIYNKTRSEALEQSHNLQQVEASVLSTERCPGKSLCYFTVAEYKIDGISAKAKVAGEIGTHEKKFSLLIIPGAKNGFLSHTAYIDQATIFLYLLFLPLAIFLFPLILALAEKYEKSADHTEHQRRKA
ncbi:MAG: preprotein translocase subunit SecG [Pseudomonas sp.]|jgi:preprotein translocase subunit SecG